MLKEVIEYQVSEKEVQVFDEVFLDIQNIFFKYFFLIIYRGKINLEIVCQTLSKFGWVEIKSY